MSERFDKAVLMFTFRVRQIRADSKRQFQLNRL